MIELPRQSQGRLYGYRSDPTAHLTCSYCYGIRRHHDLGRRAPNELSASRALTGFEIESYTLQLSGRAGFDTPSAAPLPGRGLWMKHRLRLVTLTALACQERDRSPER